MLKIRMRMQMIKPTAAQIRQSLIDHGVDAQFYKDWDKKGRSWENGMQACVVHHTATQSAVEGRGAPSLYWAVTAYAPMAVSNQVVGKDPGTNWYISSGATYHSGDGGPWRAVGVGTGNVLHWRAWGIEIDDPGRSNTINKYQIEQVARTLAALWDLNQWPEDGSRIVTHGDWTDSGPFLGESNYGPYRYRKNDTLRQFYDQNFWRNEARKYRKNAKVDTWDGTIPSRAAALKSSQEKIKNRAAWRTACRLYDLGFRKQKPLALGEQPFPSAALKRFQESVGIKEENLGNPNKRTWVKLFGKDKP
jgi:hypothetical protein